MPLFSLLLFILIAVAIEVPVAFAFLFGCSLFLILDGGFPLSVVATRLGAGLDSFPLLALPLFIFAGNLMSQGGIARRIFRFANSVVGHVPGGLGHVNVVASIIFAGMSGVAQADAAGLGKIEIKEMRKAGYDLDFAAAITAASAVIGPIIPPSGIMVIYAVMASVALDKLFLGGFLPGLLLGALLMVTIFVMVKTGRMTAPVLPKESWRSRLSSFFAAAPALFVPSFLIFGLLTGIATPTELGALTVLFAIVLSFLQKELTLRSLFDCAIQTAKTTGILAILILAATPFTWIMGINNAGDMLEQLLLRLSENPYVILLLINLVLLMAGSVMETTVILLITVPILTPIVTSYGLDPIHFGLIVVLNLLIGTITPPFGVLLFVMTNITGLPLLRVARAVLPFYVPMLLLLVVITLVPAIVTWVPYTLGG